MSEQKESIPERKIFEIKCYPDSMASIMPDEDEPLCIMRVYEPFTPTSSFFTFDNKKYMVTKCLPYEDANGKEAWMAVVQPVLEMGVGFNSPGFNKDSKIWGDNAERLQQARERLKAKGLDYDKLEEAQIDITKLSEKDIKILIKENKWRKT